MWIGIYFSVGSLFSLIRVVAIKRCITDPDCSDEDFSEALAEMYMLTAFWPILIIACLYIGVGGKYLTLYDERVNREYEAKQDLLGFLSKLDVVSRVDAVSYAKDLQIDMIRRKEVKRTRLKL